MDNWNLEFEASQEVAYSVQWLIKKMELIDEETVILKKVRMKHHE